MTMRKIMPPTPDEQFASEIESIAAEVESRHAIELGKLQTKIDEQTNTIATLQNRVEDDESKGWSAALAAMKRRLFRS